MIYIPNDNYDPALNLAMEEYILNGSGITEPILFFYSNAPSIIIGRHQNTLDEINVEYVKEHNIQIVRRCSGGGAVYHDKGNLNYSLISPGDTKATGDFSVLLTPILGALHSLGLSAVLGGRNDLLLDGAKFSGNAYYHNRFGSVTHGTILYDTDLSVLSKALLPNPSKLQSKGIQSVRSRVCNIKDHLPNINDINELKAAITKYFSSRYSVNIRNFTIADIEKYKKIADQRYRNDLWTYGKSPAYTFRKYIRQPGGWIDFRADIRDGRIYSVCFFGDYFCDQDIRILEVSLKGCPWEPADFMKILTETNWQSYFPDYTAQEFVREIFSGKANV